MRVLLRSTLVTTLIVLAGLTVGWLIYKPNATDSASAAPGLQVPRSCVPPELAAIKQLISKTNDPQARRALQAKEAAGEQAALECAVNATLHPPAAKPDQAVLLPTPAVAPTPTLEVGLQHAELLPVGDFLPSEDGNNMWVGTVNGRDLQVFAGSTSGPNDNGQQNQSVQVQGALRLIVNGDGLHASEYRTPGRHGDVQLVAACGATLVAQAQDGTLFAFDAAALEYVQRPVSCPTATP